MTEQTAIENIRAIPSADLKTSQCNALELAIFALNKRIPKELKKDYYCGFVNYECPNCEEYINEPFKYCPYCGQSIK